MEIRKISDKRKKIVIIQGSPREVNSCANMISKSQKVVEKLIEEYSLFVDFELIDLSINQSKKAIVQPCKGCVSTGGGLHCTFPCSCYFKGDSKSPDLMHNEEVYTKLLNCDGFMVISPIHWFSLTSQVKAFFDRLVCANLTITTEESIGIFGKGNTKRSNLTGPAFKSGKFNDKMKNHLEGKFASFLIHGDNGASDYSDGKYPKSFNAKKDDIDIEDIVKPFVIQCKYSGINVPNNLIKSIYINEGEDYYSANFEKDNDKLLEIAKDLIEKMLDHLK